MTSAESGRDSGQDETVPERLVCGTHTGVTQQRRDAGRPRVNVDPQKVKALPDAGLSWRAVAHCLGIGTPLPCASTMPASTAQGRPKIRSGREAHETSLLQRNARCR